MTGSWQRQLFVALHTTGNYLRWSLLDTQSKDLKALLFFSCILVHWEAHRGQWQHIKMCFYALATGINKPSLMTVIGNFKWYHKHIEDAHLNACQPIKKTHTDTWQHSCLTLRKNAPLCTFIDHNGPQTIRVSVYGVTSERKQFPGSHLHSLISRVACNCSLMV